MKKKGQNCYKKGFTLLEMTVSLGLFTIIMFIATNTFLSVVDSDRKSRSIRITTDNLNVSLEDISRRIKTGSSYFCGTGGEALLSVNDCAVAQNTLFFTDQNGERVRYTLIGNSIWRSVGSEPIIQATSPEINISRLKFYVSGSAPGAPDNKQPMVVVVIDGSVGNAETGATFKVQTTVTQRVYDN